MDIITNQLQSSTPDGLAPLTQNGIVIFSAVLSVIPILWAISNLLLLLFRSSQSSSEEKQGGEDIFQLVCRKIWFSAFTFLKFNFSVVLIIGIIFFLIIWGAIESFGSPQITLSYLWGLLECIGIGIAISVVSLLGVLKIGRASVVSIDSINWAARLISNFVAYSVCGLSSLVICGMFVFGREEEKNLPIQDIKMIGKKLIGFAFGVSTVAITTKINLIIYGKGSESALSLISEMQPGLARNHTNSIVICKAVGQNLRKVVSNALDYNMYFCMSLAGGVIAGGINIIGADQQGEIIFDLSGRNFYLPLLAFLFLLGISFLISATSLFLFSPSNGDEAALIFKREMYIIIILMSGFLALAAYLCLPVQFFLQEEPNALKNPALAYLCLLIALLALGVLLFIGQLQVNHPQFIYSVIYPGTPSTAAAILAGFQSGWLGSALPMLVWAGLTYMGQYLLGSFGVSLVSVGTALLIPSLLSANTFYSLTESASFTIWVGELGQQAIANIMDISENRRMFETQIHSHFTSMALTINYALTLNYINIYELSQISLTNSSIFIGLFIGAMLIYSFGGIILLSIQNVSPILCYDVQAQLQQNPAIRQNTVQLDLDRSSFIYTLNTTLELKYFIPHLFAPFLIVGLFFGAKMALGVICGMLVAGLQLAFSSGLSANLWNAARTEVFLGRVEVQSEEKQKLKSDSLQGKSVDIGNQIGMRIKDGIGSCIHSFISFTVLTNAVLGSLYYQIHND